MCSIEKGNDGSIIKTHVLMLFASWRTYSEAKCHADDKGVAY